MSRLDLKEFGHYDGWVDEEQRLIPFDERNSNDNPITCWEAGDFLGGCPEKPVIVFAIKCPECHYQGLRKVCSEHESVWNEQTMCHCGKGDLEFSEPVNV